MDEGSLWRVYPQEERDIRGMRIRLNEQVTVRSCISTENGENMEICRSCEKSIADFTCSLTRWLIWSPRSVVIADDGSIRDLDGSMGSGRVSLVAHRVRTNGATRTLDDDRGDFSRACGW